MKRIHHFSLSFIILCLLLVACTSDGIEKATIPEALEKVMIYEMESFSEVKEDSAFELSTSKEIKAFQEAFSSAVKQSGIVNMVDPQYKVELGKEIYFLWLNEGSGTIMNTKDTHTIYTLSPESAKQIYDLLMVKIRLVESLIQ
ncbi:hypothetical protein [Bacillus solitudinis]|uniref:hypothetical protein n=1 Tax=Bacillus solitudinis TaxID=2014074 RepID=UPI000C24F2E7|nr:hypothetical protein [Bacillus solitudinis]